jgi:hypothetical protein
MKAGVWDEVRLVVDVPGFASNRETIPAGTVGVVVEAYGEPEEAYAVDTAIPDIRLAGGYEYDNVLLKPDQFIVVSRFVEDQSRREAGMPPLESESRAY